MVNKMNENNLKKIIGLFIKKSITEIGEDIIIDNSVLQGSVLFHRMISKVNSTYEVNITGENVKTYGDLKKLIEECAQ